MKKGRYPGEIIFSSNDSHKSLILDADLAADIAKEFYNLAAELAKNYPFYEIEMAPGGFTSDMYLPDNSNKYYCPFANLTGQDLIDWKVSNFDLYTNILWPDPVRPSYWGPLTADLATINQNASIFLIGPWVGNGILADGAFVSRMSIYLNNGGDWDFPLYLPNQTTQSTYCNFSFCTLPDNRTLWGFVNVVFPLDFITVGLAAVQSANLNYMLTSSYFQLGYPDPFLASNHNMTSSDNSVCTPIDVYNWLSWTLCVSQNGGWNPKWAPALYAGVTLLCLLISILVFFVLRSRAKAVEFLGKQVVWNKELETEKEKLQAMMVRQYELIECFTKKNQLSSGIEGTTSLHP